MSGAIKINKRTGKKYRLVIQECGGCENTMDLKKGLTLRRYYVWDSDNELLNQYREEWFCADCYEKHTHTNCYYCSKSIPNGKDVKLSSCGEFCCIECDVSAECCPNGHYGGKYGCDLCPPPKCDWGCEFCKGKKDKGFCYLYENKDSYELSSFVDENKEIFNGVYCPIKHYKICNKC